ncbi:DUF397 domain-containing protein [Kitasatospora purpeofusca]|uniref:DUF397 domain-containing protein n=1 Tax=Kitasatospora purpeofusca TaxID=67352 RepID=UPI002A5A3E87|nr:DUF397 domain-containing protein [Kitasatospora purpeofusca]MDY0812393.1 DUF397 domain-containing protein [Kitasatospora purpeofusca]
MWRKSTYSGPDNECVEGADGLSGVIPVRDSKDPEGPVLQFAGDARAEFVTALRAGEFPLA